MEVVQWILNQPTVGFGFKVPNSAGEFINLTDYEFTINVAHSGSALTASYTIPASTTTVASFDLADIVDGSSDPITDTPGKWIGRIAVDYDAADLNVSVPFTIVIVH